MQIGQGVEFIDQTIGLSAFGVKLQTVSRIANTQNIDLSLRGIVRRAIEPDQTVVLPGKARGDKFRRACLGKTLAAQPPMREPSQLRPRFSKRGNIAEKSRPRPSSSSTNVR